MSAKKRQKLVFLSEKIIAKSKKNQQINKKQYKDRNIKSSDGGYKSQSGREFKPNNK
jgi:hypothetical protein